MQREATEWCRLNWSHAPETDLPRVLLVGDSIANGYHQHVVKALKGVAYVDLLATSKCVADPGLLAETRYVMEGYPHTVIHVNNGLHGWHLTAQEYGQALAVYLDAVQAFAPKATLIWCSSTPVTVKDMPERLCPEKNPQVLARNEAAAAVASAHGLAMHDLYGLTLPHPEWRSTDGFHYLEEGQRAQGEAVAREVRRVL